MRLRQRETLSRCIVALAALALLVADTPIPSSASTAPRPNILLIVTDDQRATYTMNWMGAVGRWLTSRGTRFSNAYVSTPLCCPSRVSMLSGLYMHNHGITSNSEPADALGAAEDLMVVQTLHDAGYRTGIAGKYLNSWPNDRNPAGFDRWAVTPFVTYQPAEWNVDGVVRFVSTYPTTFVRKRALSFLAEAEALDDAQPWFLYAAPMAPHVPAIAEPRYEDVDVGSRTLTPAMLERNRTDKPSYVRDHAVDPERMEKLRAHQLRSLLSVDDMVDALMTRLRDLDELRNTLVVFTSDNGMLWGEHGRRGKGVPYLPAVQVPLIVTWPGHVQAGLVDDRHVVLLDLAPTLLEAAGAPSPHPMDGHSLLDLAARHRGLLLEYQTVDTPVPTWAAILASRLEYVEYYDDAGNVTFREFYRLLKDPYQLHNLLGDGSSANDPDTSRLAARLAAYRSCVADACP